MRYVVQEHDAKRAGLHYDFRLEDGDMFKSWVVPKLAVKDWENPGTVALAIQVSNHTEESAFFEGEYGPGYGEGTVKIWDTGEYDIERKGWGKWIFVLRGSKLNGKFSLTRKVGSKKHWFLKRV